MLVYEDSTHSEHSVPRFSCVIFSKVITEFERPLLFHVVVSSVKKGF